MILDNGYMSGDNLEAFDGKDIDVYLNSENQVLWPRIVRFKRFLYIATDKGEKKDQRHINDSNRKIK